MLVAFVLTVSTVPSTATEAVEVVVPDAPDHLLVDGLERPLGIDDTPAFAWRVEDGRRGAVQRSYRVLVGRAPMSAPGDPGVVWDSGEVASPRQAFVAYAGPALSADAVYWWTVATSDEHGRFGPFAAPQRFETGLHDGDWRAQWIRRATADAVDAADDYTYARREFTLAASPIVRARAYVSADHQYQLWINGARAAAGEAFSYPDSQYYEASDVTALLEAGESVFLHFNAVKTYRGKWKNEAAVVLRGRFALKPGVHVGYGNLGAHDHGSRRVERAAGNGSGRLRGD